MEKDYICKKYLAGTCTKDHQTCEHSHAKKLAACKMRACPAHLAGACWDGPWCRYSHDPAVCRAAATPQAKAKSKAKSKAAPCVKTTRYRHDTDANASLTAGGSPVVVPVSALLPPTDPSLLAGDGRLASPYTVPCAANRVTRGPPAAPVRTSQSRKWLMDTGCGHDIVCNQGIRSR